MIISANHCFFEVILMKFKLHEVYANFLELMLAKASFFSVALPGCSGDGMTLMITCNCQLRDLFFRLIKIKLLQSLF